MSHNKDKPLAGVFFADDDIDKFRKQFPLFSEKLISLYGRFLKELKRYLNYIHKYHTNNIINFI